MLKALMKHWTTHHTSYIEKDAQNLVKNIEKLTLEETSVADTVLFRNAQSSVLLAEGVQTAQFHSEGLTDHQDGSFFVREDIATTVESLNFASVKVVDVQRSDQLLPDGIPGILARIHPDLFPYGQGHPGSSRPVRLNLDQCWAHYLRLSSRTFSKHIWFPLVSI